MNLHVKVDARVRKKDSQKQFHSHPEPGIHIITEAARQVLQAATNATSAMEVFGTGDIAFMRN
jgi:hypothetical protein